MKDHRPELNTPEKSNSGKKKDWLYFDRSYSWKRRGLPGVFVRVGLANELWYRTYTSEKTGSKSRVYRVIGIEIEQDEQDPTLKITMFTILGLTFGIGFF